MTTIYLIRHGQSEGNIDPTLYSRKRNEDVELTELGKTQIESLSSLLANDIQDNPTIFSSPFKRCIHTSEILAKMLGNIKIRPSLLLSEVNCGDQQGCEVEDFEQRPLEKHFYDKLGAWQYKPNRGESLMDVHVRVGLFVTQNHFFQYCPTPIIVSHASVCLMLHYFLIHECPSLTDKPGKAIDYWPNGSVRKYETIGHPIPFTFVKVLN